MRRLTAVLGSFLFLLLAPGVVAGYVPWRITHWQFRSGLGGAAFSISGVVLIAAGLPMLLDSFGRFAFQGLGTPAHVFPTRHLVITGMYRRVRNPMYVGVASTIFGQAILLRNVRVFGYGVFICLTFHIFIVLYEEPKLRKTFGDEYLEFCRNVRRWIPRWKPWVQYRDQRSFR